MRRTRDAQMALDYLKDSPTEVIVRVFEPFEEDEVKPPAATPCKRPTPHRRNFWTGSRSICRKRVAVLIEAVPNASGSVDPVGSPGKNWLRGLV